MATKADLRNRVLQHLHVVAGGETPSSEDAATVDEIIVNVQASLDETFLVSWDLTDIPSNVFQPLSWIMADELIVDFEVQADTATRIERKAIEARKELRRQTDLPIDESTPSEATFF